MHWLDHRASFASTGWCSPPMKIVHTVGRRGLGTERACGLGPQPPPLLLVLRSLLPDEGPALVPHEAEGFPGLPC